MRASITYYPLNFIRPAGTSRGVMNVKHSWILKIEKEDVFGLGEISVIEGLSKEYQDHGHFENTIYSFCEEFNQGLIQIENLSKLLQNYPSIQFGFESALKDLTNGGQQCYFKNSFSEGKSKIPINGLIWMGDESYMQEQVTQKLEQGFTTLKMKIGAIDVKKELNILRSIRMNYSVDEITLRVDANGAFNPENSFEILEELRKLEIHSIEQPIKAGNWIAMKQLCEITPVPIALDEELIGIHETSEKEQLLDFIQPQYIILKPSLHGGITGTQEWIKLAEERSISWWMTSALESNIGLKAICHLTAEYNNPLPQGLGTGSLYSNNFESDLVVEKGMIFQKRS